MALTKTPVCDFGKKAEDFKLKSINNKLIASMNHQSKRKAEKLLAAKILNEKTYLELFPMSSNFLT